MLDHIGIIMDGNRRWAKSRMLPAFAGHKAGADNVKKIVEYASDSGVKYITLWALSRDNLTKRDPEEVKGIIKLVNHIETFLGDMFARDVKFETIGNIQELPQKSQDILTSIKKKTENNTGIVLTIALVYGGQDEIIRATQKIIQKGISPENITVQEFRKYLDTAYLPKADLIIRTGGDIRHSGFLLYDSEYSEYYFTEKKWPEFTTEEFQKALDSYGKSNRNFGK